MSKKNNLLVAAGGTGGHIFPALAVSKEVENQWNIHWLGVNKRLDANFIPKKYNLRTLTIKTPRKNIFLFYQYIKILMSTFQIIRILKEKKINLVFTTGGYISAPTIVASKFLRIPVIIHESNLIPGMVTKYFGFLCNYVFLGFEKTNSYLKNFKNIQTAFASGWMSIRALRKRSGYDKGFAISDHADWDGILEVVKKSEAKNIFFHHGDSEALSKYLAEKESINVLLFGK